MNPKEIGQYIQKRYPAYAKVDPTQIGQKYMGKFGISGVASPDQLNAQLQYQTMDPSSTAAGRYLDSWSKANGYDLFAMPPQNKQDIKNITKAQSYGVKQVGGVSILGNKVGSSWQYFDASTGQYVTAGSQQDAQDKLNASLKSMSAGGSINVPSQENPQVQNQVPTQARTIKQLQAKIKQLQAQAQQRQTPGQTLSQDINKLKKDPTVHTLANYATTAGMIAGGIIGGVGGAAAGEVAEPIGGGIPVGAAGEMAGASIGAGIGSAGGSFLQQSIDKGKVSEKQIMDDAANGAITQLAGEAFMGIAGAILPKIPIAGAIWSGISKIPEGVANKLFGVGNLNNYKEGAVAIGDTVSKYGLDKANTGQDAARLYNAAKQIVGNEYNDVFNKATEAGINATDKDISDAMIDAKKNILQHFNKLGSEAQEAAKAAGSGMSEAAQTSMSIAKTVDNTVQDYISKYIPAEDQQKTMQSVMDGTYQYPLKLVSLLKQSMADGANFASKGAADTGEQLYRSAYNGFKTLSEDMAKKVGTDMSDLNDHYYNLTQIGNHLIGEMQSGAKQGAPIRLSPYQIIRPGFSVTQAAGQAADLVGKTLPSVVGMGLQNIKKQAQQYFSPDNTSQ